MWITIPINVYISVYVTYVPTYVFHCYFTMAHMSVVFATKLSAEKKGAPIEKEVRGSCEFSIARDSCYMKASPAHDDRHGLNVNYGRGLNGRRSCYSAAEL